MKRISMRNSYIAFGTIATLAAALAACSGGGSSPSPSVGNSNLQAPPQSFGAPTTITGPAGNVTLSITIPQRSGASAARSAAIHKLYGPKHADAHIRSMANTSPTASVRAVGAQINRYAAQLEASNRRGAQYIAYGTRYMELVITDASNNVVVDKANYCYGTTCTGSYSVPVGTGYHVSLFLYDDCAYLLSVGTVAGVNVTQGATTPVTITLNGVAAYVDVEPNSPLNPFIADASEHQTFNVGATLIDADYNTIWAPGQPVDESLKAISGISVVLTDSNGSTPTDVTPTATQIISVSPFPGTSPVPYQYTTTNYTYAGVGSEKSVVWSATTTSSGSPLVASSLATGECAPSPGCGPYSPNGRTYASGSGHINVTPVQLIFTNPEGFLCPVGTGATPAPCSAPGQGTLNPLPGSSPSTSPSSNPSANPSSSPGNQNQSNLFEPQFSQANASAWALEFPNLYNPGSGYVGLQEYSTYYQIAIPFSGTVSLTDNQGCNNVVEYGSSPLSFTAGNTNVVLTAFDRTSLGPTNTCQLVATDSSPFSRTAYLSVYYDNPSLTIQSHARSAK